MLLLFTTKTAMGVLQDQQNRAARHPFNTTIDMKRTVQTSTVYPPSSLFLHVHLVVPFWFPLIPLLFCHKFFFLCPVAFHSSIFISSSHNALAQFMYRVRSAPGQPHEPFRRQYPTLVLYQLVA